MNRNTLIGLAVAALLAIVAAIVLNQRGQPRSTAAAGTEWLVPELRDRVNEVSKIVVTGGGSKVIATFERGANGWGVAEKGGYAADTGKLREFLLALADATLVEEKTSSKEKYALLGVEDVADADAKGVQVDIDGLGKPIGIILGNPGMRGSGRFVRRVGDAHSWLASTAPILPKSATEWLRKDLADVPAPRIASVAITRADGGTLRVAKANAGDADFVLSNVPKGREVDSAFSVNALASMLSGLTIEDVVPAADQAPGDRVLKARYETFDGLVVDIAAWPDGDRHFARFAASLDAARADAGIAAAQAAAKADFDTLSAAADAAKASKDAQPDGATDDPIKPLAVSDPAKDREDRIAALNKEVATLAARFDGRTFQLPAYKYANLDKSPESLLKPVEAKTPAAARKK